MNSSPQYQVAFKPCQPHKSTGDWPCINPVVEQEGLDSEEADNFTDGEKGVLKITAYVQKKWNLQAANSEEKEEEEEGSFEFDHVKALAVAEFLGQICNGCGDLACSLGLGKYLPQFQGEIRHEIEEGKKQTEIMDFFDHKYSWNNIVMSSENHRACFCSEKKRNNWVYIIWNNCHMEYSLG